MKHIVWGRRVIKGILVILLCLQAEILVAETSGVYISEFMAINSKILADEDGDYPDWIELFNAGDQPVDLTGWFLTDNPDNLEKWKIPALVLDAGAYRILFASEKKRNDPARNLHTNFKLSGSGEYLALVASDGKTVAHAYGDRYPAQREDVSYGLYQDQAVFFSTPTPGSANVLGTIPFAPVFSHTRGFYSEKIDVGLTSPGNGGTIYYTLDGKIPGPQTGTRYTSPIPIQQTTPLSAVAVDPGGALSEVITHTYWFLGDIVAQPESPDGYPMDWKMASASTSIPADYEMDPEICNAPEYRDLMEGALTDLPSMSLVTNKEYLFNPAFDSEKGGIYIYTGKPSSDGVDWVRPTSIEYFDPATGDEFQVNCRLKLHGGNSRNPSNSPKHGFELTFRSEYGPSKLNFHLFDEKGATNEFNNLVLRAGYNYSWVKNNETQRLNAQNLQDPWAKNTQLDMGKTSAHERFVHLYINGLYWGVYNLSEKYTNDFFESYMKGSEDDFDIIKEKQVVSAGNISAYNALIAQMNSGLSSNANYQKIQGNNPDGTLNPAYANLLDMNNYIDYMLINYYVGNLDWNKNNWVMARNRVLNEAGFRFLCWDVETAMTDLSIDLVSEEGDSKTPMSFIKYLKGNADFKILMADRAQKHMLAAGGALTPAEAIRRYEDLAAEIDQAIIAESARWGDYRKDVAPSDAGRILYTRNEHWIPRKEDLLQNYFPYRTDIVLEQLRKNGLFPDIEAPLFSHESGEKTASFQLDLTAPLGEIYYTTDGTDPREPITSNVSASARTFSGSIPVSSNTTVKARARAGNEWSPLSEAKYTFEGGNAVWELAENRNFEHGNYPNPFSESTRLFYTLPADGYVEISIHRIDGRLVDRFVPGLQESGRHSVTWSPGALEAGVYIYRIRFDNQLGSGKLIRK